MICLAKAITGGYTPMGATVVTKAVAGALNDDFSFYSTYGWHPVSVAAAIATIKYVVQTREALLTRVNELSDYFSDRLAAMDFGDVVESG